MAQSADDLFPHLAKHTLEREEQEQEKWINLSKCEAARRGVRAPKLHCLVSFIIVSLSLSLSLSLSQSFVFPLSFGSIIMTSKSI